jgi:hypothetical protein
MHIHAAPMSSQAMSLAPTQATQQTIEARRAAAEVRRKLTNLAANDGEEKPYRVEARGESDPNRRQQNPQHDEEAFRSIFVSISA